MDALKLTRRALLASWAALAARTRGGSQDPKRRRGTVHVYADETGLFGRGWWSLGLLAVDDPELLKGLMTKWRKAHSYRTQLRYRSTDKFKEPVATRVIDEIVGTSGVCFHANVVDVNTEIAEDPDRAEAVYHAHYESALREIMIGRKGTIRLHLESREPDGQLDPRLSEHLERRFDSLKLVKVRQAKNDLLQIADLLTGTVAVDVRGVGARVKMALHARLNERLENLGQVHVLRLKSGEQFTGKLTKLESYSDANEQLQLRATMNAEGRDQQFANGEIEVITRRVSQPSGDIAFLSRIAKL